MITKLMNLCELPYHIIQTDLNLSQFTLVGIVNGISKKVYLVTDGNNHKTILYIWQKPILGLTKAHTDGLHYLYAEGFEYFCHNTRLLTDLGIRVPRIIKTGHFSAEKTFDYAYVECFDGISLQEYLQHGNIANITDPLNAELNKFYTCSRDYFGFPMLTNRYAKSCQCLCYEHAVEELEIACSLDSTVKRMKHLVLQQLDNYITIFVGQLKPVSYALIHGEPTPPHVWLLTDGTIGFIDIEGIKYFDIEFEYALLDMLYNFLSTSKPKRYDRNKLLFYKLYHRICWLLVSVNYLRNIDASNKFFIKLRHTVIRDLYERDRECI
ncbi:Phosphotransferase enzyme family protein [Sporomusa ovata DSM 2662]|uniref:Aminoglycoside phosphotransferase domain-containing protein n=1 Tax=Sporomusa ovata TaxID=2378 RepID=A0A0U1L3Z5_9FIRM|nr:phosphotransferase [Sporomusa ovata]EQB25857.1 phosphotransferase enzyme family [Sporomusa ovata DSM 2662]CQR74422.1 hypothetical protein SpAn4DRAFT_0884 [Sporomusa ovata]